MLKRTMIKRSFILLAASLLMAAIFATNPVSISEVKAASQTTYYVSPSGSDSNPGTLTQPFKTINKARNVVRTVNTNMTGDIYVYLRGGTYRINDTITFENADSGTNGYNVIYANYPGESPVVDGGQAISGAWTLYDANKNIYAISGVTSRFRQLYVNGKKAIRARTPNLGYAGTNSPNFNRLTGADKNNHTLSVASSQVANWNNFNKAEMHLMTCWGDSVLRLSSYTVSGSNAVLKIQSAEDGILFQRPYPWVQANQCYYFENAYELIDAESEWYLNESTNTLYYKPRTGEVMSSAAVEAPIVETLVKLAGTSTASQMHNVAFQGITFRCSTYMRPSNYGFLDGQAGQYNISANPQNKQYVGRPAAGVLVQCANNIRFENNTFTQMAATGLDFFYGTHDDRIVGNVFSEIGGNAISLGKFTQNEATEFHVAYNPADVNEICTNDRITDNYIINSTTEIQGACGIACGYPQKCTIEHNEVCNVNYTGISVGYGWTKTVNPMKNNSISFNNIHEVEKVMADGSGIYTLSNQTPSLMLGNYIHDFGTPKWADYGVFGLYLDEQTSGYRINDNVLLNAPGIHFNGCSSYNTTSNNSGSDQNTRDFAGVTGDYYGGNGLIKLTGSSFGASPAYASGTEYDKASDGNIDSYYDYANANGGITGIDLGTGNTQKVTLIRYYPRSGNLSRMTGGKFQGSNDGTNYTDLYTIGTEPALLWNTAKVTNTTAWRYLRYVSSNGGYGNVAEIEFYTSNEISRSGWSAKASSTDSGSATDKGIDADDNTRWVSGANQTVGAYYQVNLGSQQSIGRVLFVGDQNSNGDFPAACDIFISADGVNWGTAVASVTGNNFITIDKTFTPKTGQYIKVQITQAKNAWWNIRNFRAFNSVYGGSIIPAPTGDLNGDMSVDVTDYALMKKYLLGLISDFPVQNDIAAGDLNLDGTINALDFAVFKKYLLGDIQKLP